MKNERRSVTLSLISCYAAFAVVLALIVFGKEFFDLYFKGYRAISSPETLTRLGRVLSVTVYSSCVLGLIALSSLLRLLHNIRKDAVFVTENAKMLSVISWCCFAVSVIMIGGGLFYLPLFVVAAAAGFVAIILRVVMNVMRRAIALREENDLTI